MKVMHKTIEYQTKGAFQFIDITDKLKGFVKQTGIKDGLVNVQSLHTTCALIFNENEPLLLEDIKAELRRLVPKEVGYNHDDFTCRTVNMCDGECDNGHAHCRAILLQPSVTINLIDGELQLGTWQRLLFCELDRPRRRKVQFQVLGF